MAKDEVEERSVETSELEAGVKLKAGHPVLLLVGGVPGQGMPDASGGTDASGSGTPSGGTGTDPSGPPPSDNTGTEPTGTGTATGTATGTSDASGDASGSGDPTGGGTATGSGTGGGTATGSGTGSGSGTGTTAPPPPTPSKKVVFDAAHFETDKAFPLPGALQAFRDIAKLANDEPQRDLLVLGHTDAVGPASHNLGLSGDRANVVASYLKNDVGAWMPFFDGAPSSKKWGTRELQHMLRALPWNGDEYLKREAGDSTNADVKAAMARFQRDSKLPETAAKDSTGLFDEESRQKLVEAYMAADGTTAPAPTQIEKLGCGQRHLKVDTQAASAENRRVEVLAFEKKGFTPSKADYDAGSDGKKGEVYKQWIGASTDVPKGSGG